MSGNVTDSSSGNMTATGKSNTVTNPGCADISLTENHNNRNILYDDRETDYTKRFRRRWGCSTPVSEDELRKDYERGFGGVYKIPCHVCKIIIYAVNPRTKYCSDRCTNDASIERRKKRKLEERQKYCDFCLNPFTAESKDTKYCSDKHKQAAYRKRIKDENEKKRREAEFNAYWDRKCSECITVNPKCELFKHCPRPGVGEDPMRYLGGLQ